jgi:hypothetical protein
MIRRERVSQAQQKKGAHLSLKRFSHIALAVLAIGPVVICARLSLAGDHDTIEVERRRPHHHTVRSGVRI